MMLIPPKKFWGHPDDWSDAAWDEYLRIMHSRNPFNVFRRFIWGWK